MKSITKPIPVARKPHIFKCPIRGWVAKCPSRYGSLRGFGDTPVAAYNSLMARYVLHWVWR